MKIDIKKAIPEDAQEFTDCLISCWQSAYKEIVPKEYLENMVMEREQRLNRNINSLKNPGNCEYFCVEENRKMIGFIIINISQNENKSCLGEIWVIYLIEEYCNKGYGKILLEFAINKLKMIKQEKIYLWVFEDNNRARKFYENNNFEFNGEKREMNYGKPLTQLKYVLKE